MSIILFIIVLCSFFNAGAQIADTLQEVQIGAKRPEIISNDSRLQTFSPGQKIKTIDSLTLVQYQFQSVANLLAQQLPVFVRSYGFNGLATLNFRGASAAQSQVYWDGVPLQNAAQGIADISLFPVSLADKMNIVYGSSSALWGSGNVGGALVIEHNEPVFSTETTFENSVAVSAGSFRQFSFDIHPVISAKRFYLSADVLQQSAKNEFSYTNNGIDNTLTNAATKGAAISLHAAYKLNDINTLSLTGFYRKHYREIPPALFEPLSVKNQNDRNLRLQLNWKQNNRNGVIYAKAAFIKDEMLYNDSIVALNTQNVTGQLYGEAGINYKLNTHHRLLLFAPLQYSWIDRELTADTKAQTKLALAAAWAVNYFKERLNLSLNIRDELVDGNSNLLPGVNASYSLFKWLSLRGNVQRTYRVPTLNELYYVPGGNDKLKPEQGWNEDIGYTLKLKQGSALTLTHDLSYFNRNIHNWIIWFGGSVWTPHNIATVHSRGVETENNLLINSGRWKFHLGVNTAYVLATTTESYLLNDGSINKQIPYSPRYNGQLNAGFAYRGWYFNYNHTYTGYRFITTDESQWLEPYNTANIQLLYTVIIRTCQLQFSAQCNNLFNTNYEVVNARPMPGTNWLAGLKLSL